MRRSSRSQSSPFAVMQTPRALKPNRASAPASAKSEGVRRATAKHAAAQPASGFAFNYWVDATTTLKKLNQTVTVPRGTFQGTIDFSTSRLTGTLTLPPATAPFKVAGLPLATATFKITTKNVTASQTMAAIRPVMAMSPICTTP